MTLLLVDANNLAMRSIHAMARSGLSADGMSTGPLVSFVNGLSKHIRDESPDRVALCWDGGRSSHRLLLDQDYKAHRAEVSSDFQESKDSVFLLAREFCVLANVFQVEMPGVEADDLIAYHCAKRMPNERVVILSSDKDFLQLLVDDRVEQVRFSSAGTDTDRWTASRVEQEYLCQPEHLPLAMALAGDVSDNVIGVPRFGMKTAIKALTRCDFDLGQVMTDEKVSPYADRVRLNLQLVDLLTKPLAGLHLPEIPSFLPTRPGGVLWEPFLMYLAKYQMRVVQQRLYENSLWSA